jgi:hypothetical protein
MDFTSVAKAIQTVQPEASGLLKVLELIPGVGTIAGGVDMALSAFTSVTKALGLPADSQPDAVAAAIATDPQAALKMKQADLDYNLAMANIELQKEQLAHEKTKDLLVDAESARDMNTKMTVATGKRDTNLMVMSWAGISVALGVFLLTVALSLLKMLDAPTATLIGNMNGIFLAKYSTVFDFWMGAAKE